MHVTVVREKDDFTGVYPANTQRKYNIVQRCTFTTLEKRRSNVVTTSTTLHSNVLTTLQNNVVFLLYL